ncbi:MAG: O-antigen polymerase [Patescibacteria group bacterium]
MTKKRRTGGNRNNPVARTLSLAWIGNNPIFFVVALTVFSLLASLVTPVLTKPASAAPEWPGESFIADDVYKNASAHQHYYWLYACFRHVDIDKVTPNEMSSWDFFEGNTSAQALGAMYPGKTASANLQGTRDCQTESLVQTAFGYLGFDNPRTAFCGLSGAQYEDGQDGNVDDCIAGVGDKDWDNDKDKDEVAESFKNAAFSKKPAFGGPEEYVRAYATLVSQRGCQMEFPNTTLYESSGDVPGAASSNSQYAVPVFVPDGEGMVLRYIQGVGIPTGDSNLAYVATTGGSFDAYQKRSCDQIVNIARDNAGAYSTWLRDNPDALASTEVSGSEDSSEEDTTTCAIDGIGWIVCPVMNFLATINDLAFIFLRDLLEVRPALVQDEGTQTAWSTFRDFANIAFVISFMVIVYSQITSAGISNYGIKKMLPRIVVAAILVNISFYVCALMVDASNIVGSSIYSFFQEITPAAASGTSEDGGTWSEIIGAMLVAGVGVLLIVAIALAPTVLIALAVIILILVARQALVLILIIVSPLAFVAYLLPNTEDWFKKWWKAFVATLMVFPIVGIVFGASTLASNILMGIAGDGGEGGDDEQILKLVALAVLAVPLFAVPAILKGSLSAAGNIGQRVSGLADRSNRMGGKQLGGRLSQIGKGLDNRRTELAQQRKGIGRLDAFRRGRMRRDSKYEALDARGKAAAAAFGVNDPKASKFGIQKSDAEHAMKTANVDLEANAVQARSLDEIVAHNVANARLDSANRARQSDYTGQLVTKSGDPTAVALAAAGVQGAAGARRVAAAAKASQSKEMMENIQNIQSTLPYEVASDNSALEQRFAAADTTEERVAYAKLMRGNGSPGIESLKRSLSSHTEGNASMATGEARDKALSDELDLKEILAFDNDFRASGRDFEVWANNEKPGKTFKEVSNSTDVWSDQSAQRFASMSKPAQMKLIAKLAKDKPDELKAFISRFNADATAAGKVKGAPQEMLAAFQRGEDISSYTAKVDAGM